MGLFLYIVGSASPTEASVNEVLHCEGVNNKSYVCETGHCCGETRCCSHYYELWWFWLVWAIIFILSCCCVCHHRRTKHRLQQQQRQHEINLIAYREVHNYSSLPFYFRFLPNYLLPDYEEVVHRPATPPPPYSALHTGPPACSCPTDQQEGHFPPRQTTPVPPVSDMLCSRTSLEEIHTSSGYHQKDDSKDQLELEQSRSAQSSVPLDQPPSVDKQGECRKEQLRNVALPDEKERIMGRHRRFTGDSGIEVCVCGQGSDSCEPKEFEGLLSEEDQENSKEFCEECDHHSYREEEQGLLSHESRAEQGALPLPLPQPHPVSLNLHTINEQEGPYQSNTESQT